MVATLPEFYVRKVTLDDLKYAQQATDLFNTAYGANNNGWASVKKTVRGYYTTRQDIENYIRESVAGNLIQFFLFQRDAQGNDKAVAGTLTVESKCTCAPSDLAKGDGLLGRFSVDIALHSKGLGNLLMEVALKEMKNSNYTTCSMLVFENRTEFLDWCKRLGFVDTMQRSPFHPPKGAVILEDVPFALLKKKL
ncbi:hypothetical protein HMPREF1544_07439 [Mucor circinelloides 1006PhL]|uniref:N-acetyltransferase domain-containing protein n=1 Tax=Mucor circinelloides f. circinelloides (strain 1006PhL) TaxID=1220926 RepID=S2K0T9_MUCC1|nr:hypothetical protein HMPREF1544_07439 [Mucor circinelloides 1006PhL]